MKTTSAVSLLTALGHEHRLSVFRKLVQAGPEGVSAGALSDELGVAPGTLSFHLKALTHAGLISPRPERQFIYYCANFELMNELLQHLTENCCGGRDCGVGKNLRRAKPTKIPRAA